MAQSLKRQSCSWHFEDEYLRQGHKFLAGVDEAGRGCLAGPVVAAALIFLDRNACPEGVDDSKLLTRKRRQVLHKTLSSHPGILWAVGSASVEEIEKINILRASHLAMQRACASLPRKPDWLLVDGLPVKLLGEKHRAIVDGDAQCFSIAAASIIAKETRDLLMEEAEKTYPGYGFAQHKGYGTALHMAAVTRLGPCPLHRKTFGPIRQLSLPL